VHQLNVLVIGKSDWFESALFWCLDEDLFDGALARDTFWVIGLSALLLLYLFFFPPPLWLLFILKSAGGMHLVVVYCFGRLGHPCFFANMLVTID